MEKSHHYRSTVTWTGNRGSGTLDYRAYSRDHQIRVGDKEPTIPGSSDPAFRGDAARYNPEELFLASLSSCHMLWYLHLAAVSGVVVLEYTDRAEGTMEEGEDGSGRFTSVTLRPEVRVAEESQLSVAEALHERAGEKCFLAASVNFPVRYRPLTSC